MLRHMFANWSSAWNWCYAQCSSFAVLQQLDATLCHFYLHSTAARSWRGCVLVVRAWFGWARLAQLVKLVKLARSRLMSSLCQVCQSVTLIERSRSLCCVEIDAPSQKKQECLESTERPNLFLKYSFFSHMLLRVLDMSSDQSNLIALLLEFGRPFFEDTVVTSRRLSRVRHVSPHVAVFEEKSVHLGHITPTEGV